MKKRGLGEGKWNGAGGKVGNKEEFKDETVEEGAIREVREEIGIITKKLEQVADIFFRFPHKPEWDQHCHIFFVHEWDGEPIESEEMSPKWFALDSIPFSEMWNDDPLWLPRVLRGERLIAHFDFNKDNEVIKQRIRKRRAPRSLNKAK